ncbi:MAG: oxygenase MpaB family protein [Daejeonella sp.]
MELFVRKDSVVREIWGNADVILFIFAGASAEFALNKAVDWLYYTGKLPSDPIGRLFSTVEYARLIVFSNKKEAVAAIEKITAIHQTLEQNRGFKIPDWAYRDVLFMLIDYSIRSFELLARKLTYSEKQEVFEVFLKVGQGMNLIGLPQNFKDWIEMRESHLENDLQKSEFTIDLFKQYKKHLGFIRYKILLESQILVLPQKVKYKLNYGNHSWLKFILSVYKFSKFLSLDKFMRFVILPSKYFKQIEELNIHQKN